MPARDIYHEAVKAALIRDGWTITHDPYRVSYGGRDAYIDLGAQRDRSLNLVAAERGLHHIAVEIKTFGGPSVLAELQQAVGQYVLYRTWMRTMEPDRILYLAVDEEAATNVFAEAFAQVVADELQIRLLVVDVEEERIVAWKPFPTTER
jgi:hypothetical protein